MKKRVTHRRCDSCRKQSTTPEKSVPIGWADIVFGAPEDKVHVNLCDACWNGGKPSAIAKRCLERAA